MNVFVVELTYLIGLVVELSVVLSDLSLLGVVPDRHGLVELGLLSPFLGVQEPIVAVSPPVATSANLLPPPSGK